MRSFSVWFKLCGPIFSLKSMDSPHSHWKHTHTPPLENPHLLPSPNPYEVLVASAPIALVPSAGCYCWKLSLFSATHRIAFWIWVLILTCLSATHKRLCKSHVAKLHMLLSFEDTGRCGLLRFFIQGGSFFAIDSLHVLLDLWHNLRWAIPLQLHVQGASLFSLRVISILLCNFSVIWIIFSFLC